MRERVRERGREGGGESRWCKIQIKLSSIKRIKIHGEQKQDSVLAPTCMKTFESEEGHLETQGHRDIARILNLAWLLCSSLPNM